jgi:hypothetical protein
MSSACTRAAKDGVRPCNANPASQAPSEPASASRSASPPTQGADGGPAGLAPIRTGRMLRFGRLLSTGSSGDAELPVAPPPALDMSEAAAARRAAMAAVLQEPAPPRCVLPWGRLRRSPCCFLQKRAARRAGQRGGRHRPGAAHKSQERGVARGSGATP